MFELHQFCALFEPAWQADPNRTAAVLGELTAYAKRKGFETTACILETCLRQLAEGVGISKVGVLPPVEEVGRRAAV